MAYTYHVNVLTLVVPVGALQISRDDYKAASLFPQDERITETGAALGRPCNRIVLVERNPLQPIRADCQIQIVVGSAHVWRLFEVDGGISRILRDRSRGGKEECGEGADRLHLEGDDVRPENSTAQESLFAHIAFEEVRLRASPRGNAPTARVGEKARAHFFRRSSVDHSLLLASVGGHVRRTPAPSRQ